MIFSLSIQCPMSEYTIEYSNKEFRIHFKKNVLENVLKIFIDEFLIHFEYKKKLNKELFTKAKVANEKIVKYGCEIYADDLKCVRNSKVVKRQKKIKNKSKAPKKMNGNFLIQLDSSPCVNFIDRSYDSNLLSKKLKYSDLELRMSKSLKRVKEEKLLGKMKNKKCQTKSTIVKSG